MSIMSLESCYDLDQCRILTFHIFIQYQKAYSIFLYGKKDANILKRRQMQCMESVKLSFWRLYCKPFQFNLKCIFMITIPAQRRDAQTTEMKNF